MSGLSVEMTPMIWPTKSTVSVGKSTSSATPMPHRLEPAMARAAAVSKPRILGCGWLPCFLGSVSATGNVSTC